MEYRYLAVLVCLLCCAGQAPAAEELNWAQRLVGPVSGTSVMHNETVEFGRYNFAAGPEEKKAVAKVTQLEGRRSAILYTAPGKSSFQIFSVYRNLLKEKGYEIVFSCEGAACGDSFSGAWYDLNPFESNYGWNNSYAITAGSAASQFYLAARKKSAGEEVYVSVYTNTGRWSYPVYRVDVAVPEAMKTGVVQASKIEEAIKAEGRMAFYGITFDTGSSAIKAESGPVLAELAAFLKTASGQSFYVAGHTDDEGDLQANMTLSQARAGSVVRDLVSRGVPAAMLSAHGAGPLSPVATNFTPEGRALNRRVEIVRAMRGQREASHALRGASRSLPADIPDFEIKQQAVQAAQQQAGQQAAQQQAQQAAAAAAAAQQAAQQQAAQQAAAAIAAAKEAAAKAAAAAEAAKVPVPKVTGMWLTPGKNLLIGQGFKVKALGKSAGIIRKQDPAPDARVEKGSTVTITVGK